MPSTERIIRFSATAASIAFTAMKLKSRGKLQAIGAAIAVGAIVSMLTQGLTAGGASNAT